VTVTDESFYEHVTSAGMSRRDFMKLCGVLAGSLSVFGPLGMAQKAFADDPSGAVANALKGTAWTPVIWMSLQGCTGCTEAFARGTVTKASSLLLSSVWLDYQHTLMAAAGAQSELQRTQTMQKYAGRYVLVVDGAVPTAGGGRYCTIAGRAAVEVLRETATGAAAVVAAGTCAAFGGLAAAKPNPTKAVAVGAIVAGKPLINVSGCPPIPDVLNGTLAYFIVNGGPPPLDALNRPVAQFGATIHSRCPRRPNFDAAHFALAFDDAGAKKGYCMYMLGCKGPITHSACPSEGWLGGLSSPIASGHPCVGCTEPSFWDRYHVYQRGPAPS
jgi:hydrogenase small subunit